MCTFLAQSAFIEREYPKLQEKADSSEEEESGGRPRLPVRMIVPGAFQSSVPEVLHHDVESWPQASQRLIGEVRKKDRDGKVRGDEQVSRQWSPMVLLRQDVSKSR